MAAVNLKSLVGKMNDTCRRSLEAAAGICMSRSNYNVEIEHWLLKLIEMTNTDIDLLLHHYGVDMASLQADITKSLDRLRTGNSRPPALAQTVVDLAKEAWVLGSLEYQANKTRSGHVLAALLSDDSMARAARDISDEFEKISPDSLKRELQSVTANSEESQAEVAEYSRAPGQEGQPRKTGPTKTPNLDQFTIDLTGQASSGKMDPVLGRDDEIRQMIDILSRRRQNNPILTGEAGVGKTAVVEGFAQRIAAGDVPESMKNVQIKALDLTLLQAGAGVKGEFENRLKSVVDEVKGSPIPIILFIDEAHQMIGAGGQAGQGDAANILKPALARGELRTIAATTWAEYKKCFERDAALARRFQVVKVEEPSVDSAIEMMQGFSKTLEKHHKVRILNEGIVDAVRLSSRYISGRQLPDKSVSLLDTTCARIGTSQGTTPPPVEDGRRRIEQLEVSIGILEREQATGADHAEAIDEKKEQLAAAKENLAQLEERWEKEQELVEKIHDLRSKLEGTVAGGNGQATAVAEPAAGGEGASKPTAEAAVTETAAASEAAAPSPEDAEKLREELNAARADLEELQGESPLIHECVDGSAVAETVSAWTGIPLGRMVADEVKTVLNLKELMEKQIVGQSHALDIIGQSIRTSRANIADPRVPIGVFLLAGTSGVGKTETAIVLSELLYGGEQNMTVINMSEFKEEHKVSLLMGSPPGYVGYGEGGVLTEAVRRKPYSVVLLDEMEKAHPGVQDIFYQVFDKGHMKDSEGRDIDFKNTVIIMTTNAGTDLIKSLCEDEETMPDPEAFTKAVFPELLNTFKPAFLGRLKVVPFYPLKSDVMKKIIRLKLDKIGKRVRENHKAAFSYSEELVDEINSRCTEVDTGARNVDHILGKTLMPEMAAEFLSKMVDGDNIERVNVTVGDDGNFAYEIN